MDICRYRVVAIGQKSPEILSKVTGQLSRYNYEIDTISSLRLGHSFIVLLMVETLKTENSIRNCLEKVTMEYNLKLIIDHCTKEKFDFVKSDIFMRVRGRKISGVKSYIIAEFTQAGLDIHGLESESYSKNNKDYFVINIKGFAQNGLEDLTNLAQKLERTELEVTIADAWTLLA